MSGLIDRETTKEPQLDDLSLAFVDTCQRLEGLVQRNQIVCLLYTSDAADE